MNEEHYNPYELLGDFRTDLWLPVYPAVLHGAWAIRRILMAAARGYWGDVYRVNGTVILSGPGIEGWTSWMSMTPSEIESQEIGLRAACGHTVVLGMGMGWLAANAALRREVTRVTVVERDPDILAMIEAAGVFAQLPPEAREKLDVVRADALDWRPSEPVATLQADIWERYVEPQKLAEVRCMQDNIGAEALYFWGQEMEIWRYACRRLGAEPALDWPLVRTILQEDIGLPLIMPAGEDFPRKIAAASRWWTPATPDWWQSEAA
jgi:hypothetical protein